MLLKFKLIFYFFFLSHVDISNSDALARPENTGIEHAYLCCSCAPLVLPGAFPIPLSIRAHHVQPALRGTPGPGENRFNPTKHITGGGCWLQK